ncbi:MAG TPA: POTRA domain-containing protein [Acidobacteriaceae bacterium]
MRLRCFATVLLSFASMNAGAQYTVSKVVFKNPGPYRQADLEAALGVHSGQKLSVADLQAAAQQLIDTGYFDDVQVGVEGSLGAAQIVLTLKPVAAEQLTRTGFENFVWLSPEELAAAVHHAAPLFHGALPDAGNQTDAINAALAAALAARGADAKVTHTTIEPSTAQPMRAVEFRVERPLVRVHGIVLQGVSPAMTAAVDAIAQRLRGTVYNEGLAGETTQGRLLAPYNDAGYLDAKLTEIHCTPSAASGMTVDVDVTATVDEGTPYRVASLDFAGTPLVPATTLTAAAKLHPGDIASRKLLLATLAPVDMAYRRQGYMDVVVQPGPVLDRTAHTVAYTVAVVPGEQYRLRSVNATGLDPAARNDFDRGWTMKAGALYNIQYVTSFLENNTALRALSAYSFAYKAVADPQTHTVDLALTFVRSGSGR